jgi:hypothetical protein
VCLSDARRAAAGAGAGQAAAATGCCRRRTRVTAAEDGAALGTPALARRECRRVSERSPVYFSK